MKVRRWLESDAFNPLTIWSESDYGYKSTGILFAVTPDFRTTSLSGICVLEMIRKDA